LPVEKPSTLSARGIALSVAIGFAFSGLLWVLLTDLLLYSLTRDPVVVARFETAKGWAFVALGAVFAYVLTLRSASRLARDRAAVTAIIDSIADGVLLLGRDRRIHRANPAAVKMLQCDDLVGMGVEEFSRRFRVSYPNGAIVPHDGFVSQRVFCEGGPLAHKIVIYPEHDGELVVLVTAAAVRAGAGEPAELVVSVMHDISAAERFERVRDDFFSAAAHSLKTPLAVIETNAEVLARGDEHASASLAAINRQCEQMDILLQNLLVFARVRSNTLELYPAAVELAPLVERVVEGEAMLAERTKRGVQCELVGSARVHADVERLSLALRNVVDAAYGQSKVGSPIKVLMTLQGRDVDVGVRYTRMPAYLQKPASTDLDVKRLVTSMIIESHGGTVRDEAADDETTTWVRLPVLQ
jgi:signal transduction histidine kinase